MSLKAALVHAREDEKIVNRHFHIPYGLQAGIDAANAAAGAASSSSSGTPTSQSLLNQLLPHVNKLVKGALKTTQPSGGEDPPGKRRRGARAGKAGKGGQGGGKGGKPTVDKTVIKSDVKLTVILLIASLGAGRDSPV